MSQPFTARTSKKQSKFLSVAWHVLSEISRSIGNGARNILPESVSDVSPSHRLSEARLPKLDGKALPISGALPVPFWEQRS